MRRRTNTSRVYLAVALALSLAIGGGAATAAAIVNGAGQTATASSGPLDPAPVSVTHTSGMRHGQDSGGTGKLAEQFLCLIACMGLSVQPVVTAPSLAAASPPPPAPPSIAPRQSADQVLLRPTSPPPRPITAI
ncbi:MAG TPA: hypothetical protein VIK47_08950 [Kiloniellales bacterium]